MISGAGNKNVIIKNNQEETNMENNSSTGIPHRLEGIKIGDVLRFRNPYVLRHSSVRCGWSDSMEQFCGDTVVVDESMMDRINVGYECIFNKEYYNISLDMLEFANAQTEITPEDDGVMEYLSINASANEGLLDEMISRVDKTRLKKLMVIGANYDGFGMKDLSNNVVDRYLTRWARSKYEFYLMFGKELSIRKGVDIAIDGTSMRTKIIELCYLFPQYSTIITAFTTESWQLNQCFSNSHFEKFCGAMFNREMKLSKFLSNLLNDKAFDDAVSLTLSNRSVNANVSISIDPYDYLTMSYNAYDWSSCHKIGEGCYATGALSAMVDDATLIAFKSGANDVDYHDKNVKFSGNSKSWRQCVYFDKNTSAAIFSRQ